MSTTSTFQELMGRLTKAPYQGRRRMIAVAGPPASGKSTLAARIVEAFQNDGEVAQLVPMDGFHLDNTILSTMGKLAQKGAPETFDAAGFLSLIRRISSQTRVYFPTFDRARDLSIAASGCVSAECTTVVVEGNYLLFDQPDWRELAAHWDVSVSLKVDEQSLRDRLIQRWLDHGLSRADAEHRAETNDMANAATVARNQIPADIMYKERSHP